MLSLLLITALAVQYPPPASSKPATDSAAQKRPTVAAPRGTSQAVVGRMAFHDRMRELWSDHIVYTRTFIVSVAGGLPDTAEVLQRLLRNQDEIGEAIKPYYGDAAGSQLASLLHSHIQLAGKALVAAKGNQTAQVGMSQDASAQYQSSRFGENRMGDTITVRTDTVDLKVNSQNPHAQARAGATTRADTTKAKHGNVRPDSTMQPNRDYAQSQTGQGDSVQLNQAIAALRANGDSIATFFAQANPRGFAREPLRGGLQMHINLLLKVVTAHLKKDWQGSVAAFDESQRQVQQMADMLSEGIMKQFPSRFNNRTTTVSAR